MPTSDRYVWTSCPANSCNAVGGPYQHATIIISDIHIHPLKLKHLADNFHAILFTRRAEGSATIIIFGIHNNPFVLQALANNLSIPLITRNHEGGESCASFCTTLQPRLLSTTCKNVPNDQFHLPGSRQLAIPCFAQNRNTTHTFPRRLGRAPSSFLPFTSILARQQTAHDRRHSSR